MLSAMNNADLERQLQAKESAQQTWHMLGTMDDDDLDLHQSADRWRSTGNDATGDDPMGDDPPGSTPPLSSDDADIELVGSNPTGEADLEAEIKQAQKTRILRSDEIVGELDIWEVGNHLLNKEGFYVLPDAIRITDALNEAVKVRASLIMQMVKDYNLSVGEARRECFKNLGAAFNMNIALDDNFLMAFSIVRPFEVLPAPARCHDIPFEVLEGGAVITTSENLALARLS